MIAVEKKKSIPAPPKRGRKPIYPWTTMQKGDSFLFPRKVGMANARASAWLASSRSSAKFIVRETEEGVRCWRTA